MGVKLCCNLSHSNKDASANLDCLRAIAVLLVVVDHFILTCSSQYSPVCKFGETLGGLGVIAFFVHTSLVLLLSQERLENKTRHPILTFYIRRWFRIYPLAIFTVVAVVLFRLPAESYGGAVFHSPSFGTWFGNLALLQNILYVPVVLAPLWSLPFEVEMYSVLPFLYRIAHRARGWKYILGLLIFSMTIILLVRLVTGRGWIFFPIPCFIMGVLTYSLLNYRKKTIPGALWGIWLLLLFISFSCLYVLHDMNRIAIQWIAAVTIGMTYLLFDESAFQPLNWCFKTIACYSYSIYLIHMPVMWLVFCYWGITSLFWGVLFCLIIIASLSGLLYHSLENPMIRLGKKMTEWYA